MATTPSPGAPGAAARPGPPALGRLALRGERAALSAGARREIAALGGPRPGRFLAELALAWAVMVGAAAAAMAAGHPLVSALAVVVIATRQKVLGYLVHEQVHCLGFRARWGDALVNLLAAYPLLVLTVEGYARVHLAHHRHFFTARDPDFVRKRGAEWEVPLAPGSFLRLLAADLGGLHLAALVRGKRPAGPATEFPRPAALPGWSRWAFLAAAAAGITAAGAWPAVLLYWLLPLLTVAQLLVRWGALCEHYYNRPGATVAEATPIIVPRWWERLLLPNLNFTFHPYHHYFPGVAFSALPRVHEIFRREGLVDDRQVFDGHVAFLRAVLARPAAPPAAAG
jgi:fatty acid desaturase